MAQCDVCGNDYARSFEVTTGDGKRHTFDSFECAIHRLAPRCQHCGCMIIGHGMEADEVFFCCAHCARKAGFTALVDNA
jgi:Rieske Fe-S protein